MIVFCTRCKGHMILGDTPDRCSFCEPVETVPIPYVFRFVTALHEGLTSGKLTQDQALEHLGSMMNALSAHVHAPPPVAAEPAPEEPCPPTVA